MTHGYEDEWGPSPRVRGPFDVAVLALRHLGAIPARAGTIRIRETREGDLRGHPRACGDHFDFRHVADLLFGPSPRVRGPYRLEVLVGGVHGAIPARAGTISTGIPGHDRAWGHPRACGDHTS
ncbi:hypothetical protein STTU_p0084 (plasmid) [Streptomyces sp. Tu6071]|nr:hypothetical protein STTU_p0084 [Streptomyces sp. Tu6071]